MASMKLMASGAVLDLENLRPQDVNAWDIAWSHAHTNRYVGAASQPWDVASHLGLCWVCALADKATLSPATKLALLLHDAHEAYIGDIPYIVKLHPAAGPLLAMEKKIQAAIHVRFGLQENLVDWDAVDRYDRQACFIEMRNFWPNTPREHLERHKRFEMTQPVLTKVRAKDLIGVWQECATLAVSRATLFAVSPIIEPFIEQEPLVNARSGQNASPRQVAPDGIDYEALEPVDLGETFLNHRLG